MLPRAPVLDWSSFGSALSDPAAGIEDAPHKVVTTSGRAALYQALLQLQLPAGTAVLVPTYHCPTMVAPLLCAGMKPLFYGLRPDGLPDLERIDAKGNSRAGAIIVAHYFGIPRSFQAVRSWCDANGVALIEDCAHCFLGEAGERIVGHWGDLATASLSKFFPVPEAGLLVSAQRPIMPLQLAAPSFRSQLKGWGDVLEHAVRHGGLRGLNSLLGPLFKMKNAGTRKRSSGVVSVVTDESETEMLRSCDMGRIGDAPLLVSLWLGRSLARGRMSARRRENFAAYAWHFRELAGARPLFINTPEVVAPYVFPLWVDDADRVYHTLRKEGFPVFRWDRVWPGTPQLVGDVGLKWSRHVVQLLCHQDLSLEQVECTARAARSLLQSPSRAGLESLESK